MQPIKNKAKHFQGKFISLWWFVDNTNKNVPLRLGIAILCILYSFTLKAVKQPYQDSLVYKIESLATFSNGENTPFWLVSNKFGLGSPRLNNGYVRGEIFKPVSPTSKTDFGMGIDLVGGWHLPGVFRVQQLYGELKHKQLWINIGSREFLPLYNDIRLSSGDLLFSGNSLPIPQLRIGTYDFAPFWGCKGWFSIKAYLAYGFFTDSKWQKSWVREGADHTSGVLFCSRGLWFRFGNESKFPLTFDFGAQMGTQFGGTVFKDGHVINMPTGIVDWLKSLIPMTGNSATPTGEQTNVQGNMAGEYNISLSYSPKPGWDLRAYFEHYFEDHSQMFMEYGLWKDGLWGLELKFPENPFVSKFVYEFVNTTDQSGAVNHDSTPEIPEQVSGRDNYYNHYLYGAWQTWGMTMGSPLAISPLYNRSHVLTIYNTRFKANHFGLEGLPIDNLKWRILLTFTQNWGTYWLPLPKKMDNCSGLIELEYNPSFLKGWFAKGALAWDSGDFLGNNFGGMISIGYQGNFSIKKK